MWKSVRSGYATIVTGNAIFFFVRYFVHIQHTFDYWKSVVTLFLGKWTEEKQQQQQQIVHITSVEQLYIPTFVLSVGWCNIWLVCVSVAKKSALR